MKSLLSFFIALISAFKAAYKQAKAEADLATLDHQADHFINTFHKAGQEAHEAGFTVPLDLQDVPGLSFPDHPRSRCIIAPGVESILHLQETPESIMGHGDDFSAELIRFDHVYPSGDSFAPGSIKLLETGTIDLKLVSHEMLQKKFKQITRLHQACQLTGPEPLRSYWIEQVGEDAWEAWVEGVYHTGLDEMIKLMDTVVATIAYDFRAGFFAFTHSKEIRMAGPRWNTFITCAATRYARHQRSESQA